MFLNLEFTDKEKDYIMSCIFSILTLPWYWFTIGVCVLFKCASPCVPPSCLCAWTNMCRGCFLWHAALLCVPPPPSHPADNTPIKTNRAATKALMKRCCWDEKRLEEEREWEWKEREAGGSVGDLMKRNSKTFNNVEGIAESGARCWTHVSWVSKDGVAVVLVSK